jgi:hypothetical protein
MEKDSFKPNFSLSSAAAINVAVDNVSEMFIQNA